MRYKLVLAGDIDQKRNRTPRKTDFLFQSEYGRRTSQGEDASGSKKMEKKGDGKNRENNQGRNSKCNVNNEMEAEQINQGNVTVDNKDT